MTETTEKPDWSKAKRAGMGDLPPIAHMIVGDVLAGRLEDVRDMTRKGEKKGQDKKQIALHLLATDNVTLSQGSIKKKTAKRTEFLSGDKVCITVGGNLSTLLKDAVLKETGAVLGDDEDLSASYLRPLVGRFLKIARLEDGEIQKGAFKGNMVKRFNLEYI